MTEQKTYRTHWTIEPVPMGNVWPDDRNIKWYKGTPDMDNVHYCSTVEEAEREIDDAIILEQEQVIDKFRMALNDSTIYLIGAKALLDSYGMHDNGISDQVSENHRVLKAFQP